MQFTVRQCTYCIYCLNVLWLPLATTTGSDSESIVMGMLQRRTSDSKVAVRKAALHALEACTRLHRNGIKKEVRPVQHDSPSLLATLSSIVQDAVAIYERCLDPALSVRKQAMISLTSLTLENKSSHTMQRSIIPF